MPIPRRSGARMILVAALVAMLAACGAPATPSASPTSTSTRVDGPALGEPADATASCSDSSSAANPQALVPGSARSVVDASNVGDTDLGSFATFLATGVAAYISGPSALVGWGIGELLGTQSGGISPELASALGNLSTQLNQITTQLNEIETQLAAITNLIQDSTYLNAIKSLTTDHVAPILSMWQQYCDIIATQDTNATTIDQLTADILDSATGVRPHVLAIAQTFRGSSLTGDVPLPGMFSQFVFNQKSAGTFGDTTVYTNYLQPYTDYFVGLAVMGMTLMVEAFHKQGDVKGAESALADLWTDIRTIYQAGGAPITDANVITHVPTGTVWTRSGLCVVATFDSADAQTFFANSSSSSDQAQVMLAINALYAVDNPVGDPEAVAGSYGLPTMTGAEASVPASIPRLESATYTFKVGDSVCSTLWFAYGADPHQFMPDAVKDSEILPSAALYRGTGDPDSVWRDPADTDFRALVSGRGSTSSEAYLTANGFVIQAAGVGGVTKLAYNYWQGFDSGIFDPAADTYTCEFFATCGGGGWVGLHLIATPQCWLGSADYKGLATRCDTAWVDSLWPAAPPSPNPGGGGTTTTTTP